MIFLLTFVCLVPFISLSAEAFIGSITTSKSLAFLPNRCLSKKVDSISDVFFFNRVTRRLQLQLTKCLNSIGYSSQGQKHKLQIGIYSQKGVDPKRPQKVNQDAYFHADFYSEKNEQLFFTCIGVLDGHGLKGHLVSNYLSQQLPLQLHQQLQNAMDENLSIKCYATNNSTDVIFASVDTLNYEKQLLELGGLISDELSPDHPVLHQCLIKAFHAAHVAAMQDTSIPAGRNGATCVMVLLNHANKELCVAHVGDSRVIEVSMNKGHEKKHNALYRARPLSTETTVQVMEERIRIESGEGSIRGNNVFYGPVGIAMTRALGNTVMLRAGVVPTPVIETYSKPGNNSYIVIATDGIWDVMSDEAVVNIIAEQDENIQTLCSTIAEEARRKWISDLPVVDEQSIDDTTCIVVRLTE